jgi:hypothetical protein
MQPELNSSFHWFQSKFNIVQIEFKSIGIGFKLEELNSELIEINSNSIRFKLNWRKMRWKMMHKISKVCDYYVGELFLVKNHKSKKKHFHSTQSKFQTKNYFDKMK